MLSSFLTTLEIREDRELPPRTIVAPLPIIREIRAALGRVTLDLRVGVDSTVLVSADLFAAFGEWESMQREEEEGGSDPQWN